MRVIGHRLTRQHWIAIIITCITMCVAVAPLLLPGVYVSTDALYHIARVEAIYLDLVEGVFPAKIHLAAASGYGYGNGFFYPDCFLYLPALLMIAGLSLELSWKIYNILVVLSAYVSMAYSIRRLHRDSNVILCMLGAGCYIMSYRFIVHLYDTESIGSATAMIFVPLAIAGLMRIVWQEHSKLDLLIFTLAVCGIVVSHLTTAIMMLAFLLIQCMMSARRIMKRREILIEILGCALVGALLTIAFWLPMFEQLTVQMYKFQTELIYPVAEWVVAWYQSPTTIGYATVLMAVFATVALIIAYLMKRCAGGSKGTQHDYKVIDEQNRKEYNSDDLPMLTVMVVSALLYIVLTFCPPFWRTFGHWLDWMQFPERIMDAPIATMILVAAFLGSRFMETDKYVVRCAVYGMAVLVFLVSAVECHKQIEADEAPEHLESGLVTDQIPGIGAGDEWLPSDADRSGLHEPNKSYDPDGSGADGFKHDHGKYYEVYVLLDKEYYDVPYLYYKGYEAYLLDDSGAPVQQLETGKSDRLAYVRVYMPEGGEGIGHIMVTYRKTTVQKAAYVTNVAAIVVLVGYIIIETYRTRRTRVATK